MFLEDRRTLYNPYNVESLIFVDKLSLEIHKKLTSTLQKTGHDLDIA